MDAAIAGAGICGLATALLLALAAAHARAGEPETHSTPAVHFPTSCDTRVQTEFDRAIELLHSFEYPESERLFRAVLEKDPDCAMARWGVAMNQWHPLWAPPDRTALETGAAMLAGLDQMGLTEREAAFVGALDRFFQDARSRSHAERARDYRAAMEDAYRADAENPETVAFYALAVLAAADPADKTYCAQHRAAGLLNWLLRQEPRHPGALHYLIHSYDYPELAYLALHAAERYADVAPDSAHARHMPSHIFTRLGLWDRAISSNRGATASAADYTRRAGLPGHYDEGIHSIDYLVYALLQVADDEEAKRVLDGLRNLGRAHPQNFKVAYTHAASPARYALERRQWTEASRLPLWPEDFPWNEHGWARSIHHFARGLGAARSGQLAQARAELETIRSLAGKLPPDTLPYWRQQVLVHADVVASWIVFAEGDVAEAQRLAEAAADREDAVDKHPVTPGEVLPARELFADLLLELGRPREALRQYRMVLKVAPNRANALIGAAGSARAAGDDSAAAGYYRQLLSQAAPGSEVRAGVREAMAFMGALGRERASR